MKQVPDFSAVRSSTMSAGTRWFCNTITHLLSSVSCEAWSNNLFTDFFHDDEIADANFRARYDHGPSISRQLSVLLPVHLEVAPKATNVVNRFANHRDENDEDLQTVQLCTDLVETEEILLH